MRPSPVFALSANKACHIGLTWLGGLVLYLNGGLAGPLTALLLQFQMLLPAFSAMLLRAFFFKESPIYYRHTPVVE